MTHSALSDLLSFTQEHAESQPGCMSDFVAAYYENADPDELQTRGPAALYANAAAHWRLLQSHTDPSSAQVRVFNPTLAEDGYVSEHTVVHIVHANMPFLVDSVTMAVNRGNRTAHWIVHPLLAVQRDASGAVQAASSAATAHAPGTPVESVILVECDRIVHAQDREALQADLQQVLSDVRASVQDWQAMLERTRSVAQMETILAQCLR